jgi:hypothetical protein
MSEIVYRQAGGRYTTFFLLNGKRLCLVKNLGEYNSILDPNFFLEFTILIL